VSLKGCSSNTDRHWNRSPTHSRPCAGPPRRARRLDRDDRTTGAWPEPNEIDELVAQARNVPISPVGSFDRSPCGTAKCARMAALSRSTRWR
jgi:hypothetical protein